jgi:hypothetical protein
MITGPVKYGVASAMITVVLEVLLALAAFGISMSQNTSSSPIQDAILMTLFFGVMALMALLLLVSILFIVVLIVLAVLKRPIAAVAYGFLGVLLVLSFSFILGMGLCLGGIAFSGVH